MLTLRQSAFTVSSSKDVTHFCATDFLLPTSFYTCFYIPLYFLPCHVAYIDLEGFVPYGSGKGEKCTTDLQCFVLIQTTRFWFN